MIPKPPGPKAIIAGLSYALQLALLRCKPQAISPSNDAIWKSLWFRYMLILLNGSLVPEVVQVSAFTMLAVLGLMDTLAYPVVSHFILKQTGLDRHFPQFILAVTWVGNLRIIILMTLFLLLGQMDMATISLYMFPFVIWLIWATWSAAARSIENKGWLGAGMVVVMIVMEMVNGVLVISFLHPLLTQG